jgi:hypothetical protein
MEEINVPDRKELLKSVVPHQHQLSPIGSQSVTAAAHFCLAQKISKAQLNI